MGWMSTILVAGATVINGTFMALILWLYRQSLLQHTVEMWYISPLVGTELALSMQLETLQVLLIVIGLGLTGLGVFGFKSLQDVAEAEARRAVRASMAEAAESSYAEMLEMAQETAQGNVTILDPLDTGNSEREN